MRVVRTLLLVVPSLVGLGACATAPAPAPEPTPEPAPQLARTRHRFEARPPKPVDCDFEVFEEREPERPYRQIGVLPFTTNAWLSKAGRKRALRETACESGADAVLLPSPVMRRMKLGVGTDEEVREYAAAFVIWTDVPGSEPILSESEPPPPPEPGVLVVPAGQEWPGDTYGTSTTTREVEVPQP